MNLAAFDRRHQTLILTLSGSSGTVVFCLPAHEMGAQGRTDVEALTPHQETMKRTHVTFEEFEFAATR